MQGIKENDKVLYAWKAPGEQLKLEADVNELKQKGAIVQVENLERLNAASYPHSTFDVVFSANINATTDLGTFGKILNVLKPKGRLVLLTTALENIEAVESTLRLSGFVNLSVSDGYVTAQKPNYEVGSFARLSLKGKAPPNKEKVASVWKINGDDEEDVINADDLLDESDLKKPDPSSLRVCGTTGVRKACKDCSCGLADELAAEKSGQDKLNSAPKSSCGSCYLGDAFRCASCPYRGMPAFKPGEKILLSDNQMVADL